MKDFSVSVAAGSGRRCEMERSSESGANTVAVAGLLFAVASALSCGGKSDDSNPGEPEQTTMAGSAGGSTGATPSQTTTQATGGTVTATTSTSSQGGAATAITSTSSQGGAATSTNLTSSQGGSVNPISVGGSRASSGGTSMATSAVASGGRQSGGTSSSSSGGTVTSAAAASSAAGSTLLQSGGSTSHAGASATSAAGSENVSDRLAQLSVQSSFRDLKTLWGRLDGIAPKDATTNGYASTITAEQRDQWIAELSAKLGEIQASGLLSDLELLFLRNIATARIEVMRDGGYHYEMYLHRAPELFEGATEASISRLEQKLDALEALRVNCRVEVEAYRLALEQVEREATVFFVMDQLMQKVSGNRLSLELPKDLWGLDLTAELDRRLAALESDPTSGAGSMPVIASLRAHLKAIESAVAVLPAFLRELERCE